MRIVITGTPGTGKTTIAKVLGKELGLPIIHINDYVKKHKLVLRKTDHTLMVDTKKLKKRLEKENGIIEGHLACEFGLPRTRVIVLRRHPRLLQKHYKKKRYSKQKQRDNLVCEALDYCTILAETNYKKRNVFDVDTSKRTIKATANKVILVLDKKAKPDNVDFSGFLLG
jgi:adenylate kinase